MEHRPPRAAVCAEMTAAGALAGRRVLELGGDRSAYCGKLLADMGADVLRVEPPGGDPTRGDAPHWQAAPADTPGLAFLYLNTNKRSLELDLRDAGARDRLSELARDCDLLVESLPVGELARLGLGFDQLSRLNPRLVLTSISDFGQSGPHARHLGSELVVCARAGGMVVTGDPDDPPVTTAAGPAYTMASTCAASSSLIALRESERRGAGQHVDISALEVMTAVTSICGVGRWLDDGVVTRRFGTGIFASVPSGAYACRDGLAYLTINRPLHWQALAQWIHERTGNREVLDPMFEGPSSERLPYRELVDLFIGELCALYSVEDFYREGQERHLAITPVASARELCEDAHLAARGFFAELEHPDAGALRYPGAPYQLSRTPWRLRRPAPRCGEYPPVWLAERATIGAAAGAPRDAAPEAGALAGLRVVEFTAGMAGPWIGRFLAACGADVIKVESITHPDVTRLFVPARDPESGVQPQLSPWFTDWNAGKRFVSLDLTRPEGVELARRLVGECDLLVENFSTGVMEKLGLSSRALRERDSRLITFSTTGYGATGPLARYITWGPNIEALSGLATLSGFPERPCTVTQYAYPDPSSALHGLFAILCALDERERSGRGQDINLAQVEATAATLGSRLMEQLANGDTPPRRGNRSPIHAPHDIYPCRGDDRWCAIVVRSEAEWARLCTAMGRPELEGDPRFTRATARLANLDALDAEISAWTRTRDPHAVMETLQAAAVPAGAVQDVEDQYRRDAQLRERGFFETIAHRAKGEVVATGIPLGLASPVRTPGAGSAIGEDNRAVLCELCGLSPERFEELREAGVITDQAQFLARLG